MGSDVPQDVTMYADKCNLIIDQVYNMHIISILICILFKYIYIYISIPHLLKNIIFQLFNYFY